MSQVLYALIVLQGTTLSFSPGYPTVAECMAVYQGSRVACFPYDPTGTTWTAFFRLEDGSFRSVFKIPSEAECQRYVAAFRSDVPAACRQLARPDTCTPVACRIEITPQPTPPAAPPQPPPPTGSIPSPSEPPKSEKFDPKPDPSTLPHDTKPNDIQVDGRQYNRMAGLAWVEKPDSFADVAVGPTTLQDKDLPTIQPLPKVRAEAPRRVAARPQYRPAQSDAMLDGGPNPFGVIAGLLSGSNW